MQRGAAGSARVQIPPHPPRGWGAVDSWAAAERYATVTAATEWRWS